MNCQDISGIADAADFGSLAEAERRAIEVHALTCRRCAAVWAAHARLAELRIPPLPAELAARCRTLTARPTQSAGKPTLRRLTLIGAVIALTAAASMLAIRMAGRHSPVTQAPATATPPVATLAPASSAVKVKAHVVTRTAPTSAVPSREVEVPTPEALPLLPAPDFNRDRKQGVNSQLALQRAVERHPELVEGPQTDGIFAVAMVMRADGSVISSAARLTTPAEINDAALELGRSLPEEGISRDLRISKSMPLSDGRALRADIVLQFSTVPEGFDPARSSVRVDELVRSRYSGLLLPSSAGEVNWLTIFLTENGGIDRETVERVRLEDVAAAMTVHGYGNVSRFAAHLANQLNVDIGQIGLMGFLTIDDGIMPVVVDADGHSQPRGTQRHFYVSYAWPRREGETAPNLRREGNSVTTPFNMTDLLEIVERMMPDAFTVKDSAAGFPAIVLTHRGEVIRAGRVNKRADDSAAVNDLTWDQLAPGVRMSTYSAMRVTDKNGATVMVMLAWQNPTDETPESAK